MCLDPFGSRSCSAFQTDHDRRMRQRAGVSLWLTHNCSQAFLGAPKAWSGHADAGRGRVTRRPLEGSPHGRGEPVVGGLWRNSQSAIWPVHRRITVFDLIRPTAWPLTIRAARDNSAARRKPSLGKDQAGASCAGDHVSHCFAALSFACLNSLAQNPRPESRPTMSCRRSAIRDLPLRSRSDSPLGVKTCRRQ